MKGTPPPPSYQPGSLQDVSKVEQIGPGAYRADLDNSYCVVAVPNGGYVATVFLNVAQAYMMPRKQPDTIAAHWQFLSRTSNGPAVLIVKESKMGRGNSVIHISLYQDKLLSHEPWISPESKELAVAYVTNANLDAFQGQSLDSRWQMTRQPPPADLSKLGNDKDPNWERAHFKLAGRPSVLGNLEYYIRRSDHELPTLQDHWIRFANHEPFFQNSLAFVVDSTAALIIEAFRPRRPWDPVQKNQYPYKTKYWYPTVTMTMNVRRKLPTNGAEWLRLRSTTKLIFEGRYDIEVIVFDAEDNLVAEAHFNSLILDGKRNTAGRL